MNARRAGGRKVFRSKYVSDKKIFFDGNMIRTIFLLIYVVIGNIIFGLIIFADILRVTDILRGNRGGNRLYLYDFNYVVMSRWYPRYDNIIIYKPHLVSAVYQTCDNHTASPSTDWRNSSHSLFSI